MASNPRVFKHPIPGTQAASASPGDIRMITPEELCAVKKDDIIQQVPWCGMNLTVRKMISAEEFMRAADLILERCWDGERYRKELLDFELRTAVIVFYSNAELPQETEARWAVLYGTNLYSAVLGLVNQDQVKALENGIKLYMNT